MVGKGVEVVWDGGIGGQEAQVSEYWDRIASHGDFGWGLVIFDNFKGSF